MKVTRKQLIQIIKEEITDEQVLDALGLLRDISSKLDGLGNLEQDLEQIDVSIDSMAAAQLGVSPAALDAGQATKGRLATAGLEERALKRIIKEEIKSDIEGELGE